MSTWYRSMLPSAPTLPPHGHCSGHGASKVLSGTGIARTACRPYLDPGLPGSEAPCNRFKKLQRILQFITTFIVVDLMVFTRGANLAACASVKSSLVNNKRAIAVPFRQLPPSASTVRIS